MPDLENENNENNENKYEIDLEQGSIPFAHLHVHTEYSLLDGANRIKPLIKRTKELGMNSIAITDHGAMFGVIDFYKAAKAEGINPVIGCEVYMAPRDRHEAREIDGCRYYHLILLAENNTGYKNLAQLVSKANIEGMYYKPRIDKEILKMHSEGLICLSACVAGEIPSWILRDDMNRAEKALQQYLEIFDKDHFFIEIQDHGLDIEHKANAGLIRLAEKYGLGLVCTNDAHYLKQEDASFHEILLCIQMGKTMSDPARMKFSGDGYYVKSPSEMYELFKDHPEALTNTQRIADRCHVEFDFNSRHLPNFPLPEGMTDQMYLRKLCEDNLASHYPVQSEEVRDRLEYELGVIHNMGFDSYFLIVWDFINYARKEGIPVGPGRGSAAGSIVAYTLGITDIDPLKYDLLFERFLNPERVTMPDIDVDFCYVRREEVIEYVKRRYGEDHVAQIATFGTLGAKGAIRDVGRALDMTFNEVSRVTKLIPDGLGMTIDRALEESSQLQDLCFEDDRINELVDYAKAVEGLPRHSSTHAAGIVIARDPLTDYLPVMVSDGTLVTQYDKDKVEELGLLKMDFLGLRTLTVLSDAVKNIKKSRGIDVDLRTIPLVDEKTAKMLCEGKTGAVFQMESGGMTNLMKELAPEGFTDLIPLVALYRPGPLGSGMAEDFIAGRHGKKQPDYMHPSLEPILKETFGVILYQEQVMQIVQVLAGFTLGQADLLRRAMGKKKAAILMAQKDNFLQGCAKNNIDRGLALKIFDLLTHFADYGFNKSHSAAYALVAWQTAYLKANYPEEFMAAMLSSVMDTGDKVSVYIEQCRHMGISVLPPDINASGVSFSVDNGAIRFGLAAIKNVGEAALKNLVRERSQNGPFTSLMDFCSRIDMHSLNKRVIENLIKCGAFDSLGARRSQLLMVLERTIDAAASKQQDMMTGQMSLFSDEVLQEVAAIELPDVPEEEYSVRLSWEKEITGFYITGHPLDQFADAMERMTPIDGIINAKYPDGKNMDVGGLIVDAKRISTKKGETMCFITLEDYTQSIEVVVFPRTFYDSVDLLVPDEAVEIKGRVNYTDTGIKLIANKVNRLADVRPLALLEDIPEMPDYDEYYDYSDQYLEKSVYLNIKSENDNPETELELRKLFAKFHGNGLNTVYLCYSDRLTNRKIKTTKEYWINYCEAAKDEFEALLGPYTVVLR